MPYSKEHSARLIDPSGYSKFARKNIAPGIDIILGISGGKSETQAYRFSKEAFTAAEAKAWLKEHKVSPISFEKAKDKATAEYIEQKTKGGNLATEQTSGPSQTQADPLGKGLLYGQGMGEWSKGKDGADGKGNNQTAMGNESYKSADICPGCKGSGECPVCMGSSFCSSCDGEGEKPCYIKGGGKGVKDCLHLGSTDKDEGHKADCDGCDGSMGCPACSGSGECEKCGGSGECEKCGGSGMNRKKDHRDSVTHYDGINTTPEWMVAPFERTAEGFLKGRAIVTNIGVFEYKDSIGKSHFELRLPEEVFDQASLNSMKLKPITNNHPTGLVTPKNIKDVQVGNLGDNPSSDYGVWGIGGNSYGGNMGGTAPAFDRIHVAIDVMVTEENAIEDVLNGKRALSCGYECELEAASPGANWCGINYDFIQRNIRYNHVAIVDTARAGDDAAILLKLDSADSPDVLVQVSKIKEEDMLKNVKLDGVDYQAEAKVIETLTKETARADGLQKSFDGLKTDSAKLEAERDTLKDKAVSLEAEIVKLKADSIDASKIGILVKERLKINEAAIKAGVEVKEDSTDVDLKKAVILKVFPTATLDGKSNDYIDARFDGAIESIASKADAVKREVIAGDNLPPVTVKTDAASIEEGYADQKRREMMERQRNDSRAIQANVDRAAVMTSAVN